MAWGGSAPNQVYTRTDGVRSGTAVNVTAKNNGVNNTAVLADARENDFATALNLVLKRDGGNQPTANLPMNSFKLTGMGQGSARTDSLRIDQVQDGDLTYAEAAGTGNAIELTTTPTCTPVEGMVIGFFAEADNSSTTTVDLNGGGALALQVGGTACAGGEVNNGQFHYVAYDGTQWQLLNPYYQALGTGSSPQFTAINLGHASDTTIARVGAGQISVEGVNVVTVSSTDTLTNKTLTSPVLNTPTVGTSLLPTNDDGAPLGSTSKQWSDLFLASGAVVNFNNGDVTLTHSADTLTMAGGNLSIGTSAAFTAGTIELGAASDTTLSRSAAGKLAVAGVAVKTAGKETIVIPAGAMITATTSGAASTSLESSTNDVNYKVFDFDASADEHVHFNIAMPKSWNEGTVTFRVFWTSTATDTDGVAWGLQAVALSDNEAIDTAWGTAVVVTDDAQSAAGELYVTAESSAVTIAGTPAEGDLVFFRLFRDVSDANDDMTEDARLIGIQLFFTSNAATDD